MELVNGFKDHPIKLLKGFLECTSLPLPGTAQREGSGPRDANEQFDWTLFRFAESELQ